MEVSPTKFRIALCLHGLASGKNSKGRCVHSDIGAICLKKQIIENKFGYEVDVFFHTWSTDMKEKLIEWYRPKKYMVEEQINFITDMSVKNEMNKLREIYCQRLFKKIPKSNPNDKSELKCYICYKWMNEKMFRSDKTKRSCANCYYAMKSYYQNLHSLYYSYYKANQLKSQYEQQYGFTYDLVITSRFDIWVNDPIDLRTLNKDKLYFLMYEKKKEKHMIDHVFISSSKGIDQFCDIYLKLKSYSDELIKRNSTRQYLNHDIIKIHLEKIGWSDKVEELLDKFPAGALSTLKPENLADFLKAKVPWI